MRKRVQSTNKVSKTSNNYGRKKETQKDISLNFQMPNRKEKKILKQPEKT